MTTQHTPGPWKFLPETAEHLASVYAPHKINGATHIADVRTEANARLIAAAPELLEALQNILGWMNAQNLDVNCPSGYMNQAYAAIAKATGEICL